MPDAPALPPFKVIADELATDIDSLTIRQSHYYLLLANEVSVRLYLDDIKRNYTYDLKVEMLGKYPRHKSTHSASVEHKIGDERRVMRSGGNYRAGRVPRFSTR